jgi:hypothetical protein
MPKTKRRGGVWTESTYEQQCVGQNGAGMCERNVHKQFWTRDEKFHERKVGTNKPKRVHGKYHMRKETQTCQNLRTGEVCGREVHTSSNVSDKMAPERASVMYTSSFSHGTKSFTYGRWAQTSENECREECVHGKDILAVRLWTKWRWRLQDQHVEVEAISVAHERNKGKWRETK